MFLPREFACDRELFEIKLKGCTRIVGYSYNVLALQQILSWGQPNNGMNLLPQALLHLGLWY